MNKPIKFSTFKMIVDLNALLLFSVIPTVVLLPFFGFSSGTTYGVALGGVFLLTLMSDEDFRIGYQEGVEEEYEAYLEEEAQPNSE